MAGFEAKADLAVRQAVDAHITGRLPTVQLGEMRFATRNSRYRLMDGVLIDAPDRSLVGAELVGFLFEGESAYVDTAWKPGCRAVLLNRMRGRHITVTSTVKTCARGDGPSYGSGMIQAGSTAHPPSSGPEVRRSPESPSPYPPPSPPPSPWVARTYSYPLSSPPPSALRHGQTPPLDAAFNTPAHGAVAIPRPPPIPARRTLDSSVARRMGLLHSAPSRANRPAAASDAQKAPALPAAHPPALRPLPYPTLPMRREASARHAPAASPSRGTLPMIPPPPAHGPTPLGHAPQPSPHMEALEAPPAARPLSGSGPSTPQPVPRTPSPYFREVRHAPPEGRLPHWSEPSLALLNLPAPGGNQALAPSADRMTQRGERLAARPALVLARREVTGVTPTELLPNGAESHVALAFAPTVHENEPRLAPSDLRFQAALPEPHPVAGPPPAPEESSARPDPSGAPLTEQPPVIALARPIRPLMSAEPAMAPRVHQRGAALR